MRITLIDSKGIENATTGEKLFLSTEITQVEISQIKQIPAKDLFCTAYEIWLEEKKRGENENK